MNISGGITPLPVLLVSLSLVATLTGCSGTDAQKVNHAALTYKRPSCSSEVDLALALNTRDLLSEREKDYKIGPGDVLEISVFEWEKLDETKTVEARVEESGTVVLPVIETIMMAGKTVEQVQEVVIRKFQEEDIIRDPKVHVTIKEFKSKEVYVIGAVEKPGEYAISQNVTTLKKALSMAGGLTKSAGYELRIIRRKNIDEVKNEPGEATVLVDASQPLIEKIVIDLIELLEEGNLALNVVLRHGDVVQVPEAQNIYVLGFVNKPGGYPLRRPMTILEGIALAGGLIAREASPRHSDLKRDNEIIPLDLVAIAEGEMPNFYLRPDDIIDVRQTNMRFFLLEFYDFVKGVFTFRYELNPRRYRR